MNARAVMLGGMALLLVAAGAAGWSSLGRLRHQPAIAEALPLELPTPPLPPRISEGDRYDRCLGLLSADPEGARAFARSWLAEGGGDGAAHCLGLSRIALGEPAAGAAALATLAAASDATPAIRASLYSQAAQAWMMAEEPRQAAGALDAALALTPDNTDLLVDRAAAAIALEAWPAAIADLNAVLAEEPRRLDALVMRATALRQQGRLAPAHDDIRRALALSPDAPEALLERGILRQRAHDAAGARADWNRVLELVPDSPEADLAEQNLALLDAGPAR